jgi:hypothetical protein
VVVIGLLLALALLLGWLQPLLTPSITEEASTGTDPYTTTDVQQVSNGSGLRAVVRAASCYSFESVWYNIVLVRRSREPNDARNVAVMYIPLDFANLGRGPSRPRVTWGDASSLDISVRGPIESPELQRSNVNGISVHYSFREVIQ